MDKALQTQLANIEKRTGKSLEALTKIVKTSPGGMCQYKVRVAAAAEVDAELVGWIRQAYTAAG
jgi:hypothetical protein